MPQPDYDLEEGIEIKNRTDQIEKMFTKTKKQINDMTQYFKKF